MIPRSNSTLFLAAQLMNNLSELLMRRPPSPEIRHQAEAWARQAYGLIERVQKKPLPRTGWFSSGVQQSTEVCDQTLGVVLFNLGMLREVRLSALVLVEEWHKLSFWPCNLDG